MLCEKDNDLVGGDLDPHVCAGGRVLHDYADERAHHQMEVESGQIGCKITHNKLEKAQGLQVDISVVIL